MEWFYLKKSSKGSQRFELRRDCAFKMKPESNGLLKNALFMITKAWNWVKGSSIINCWRRVNIVDIPITIDMFDEEN